LSWLDTRKLVFEYFSQFCKIHRLFLIIITLIIGFITFRCSKNQFVAFGHSKNSFWGVQARSVYDSLGGVT